MLLLKLIMFYYISFKRFYYNPYKILTTDNKKNDM